MRFEYKLSGKGWAEGFIEINSNIAYFTTSYLTDALDDMLKALILLIPEISTYPVSATHFEWHEEPGGTLWNLRRVREDMLNIEIVSFEDLLKRKKETIDMNETCSIIDFVKVIIHGLDLVLSKYGADGFKEEWVNHDFPMKNYFRLKSYITNR
ncbi:hypothetical protein BC351_34090 [Paenibacillus ferrarius]|uniref:Uncharacterized protein n=1 Tax=Paenibacillus ferrarius TaxID=1469647 RepID=A0A1V4HEQ8_9BACL|nr:hypothetical protein [Paenibacillus ferrarius]OPH52008.1 hypothetical protein BC351_34090 [Paenibacillus ferrarius]